MPNAFLVLFFVVEISVKIILKYYRNSTSQKVFKTSKGFAEMLHDTDDALLNTNVAQEEAKTHSQMNQHENTIVKRNKRMARYERLQRVVKRHE